ncbi:hypothetical protein KOR34_45210 [Posidoniimonas corsicana]|uniref:Uncharacterized protein n=1 Tax=Posidoniimonas corsicana TaxID=1938618 RepID=A0A5C5V095_9BACT|nr:hypothetical protein [Posidoniimonas corsicana]TWT31145.1 hypothetical protein KOR34_45210 [Posidoniimonas corsicana]
MVAFRNARIRFRLFTVWMLTRHPKFKPLYAADVVSHDLIQQAHHLADAGYYVPAAMLARAAVESRVTKLARLSPGWSGKASRNTTNTVVYLTHQGFLTIAQKNTFSKRWERVCSICHGATGNRAFCLKTMRQIEQICSHFDELAANAMRSGEARGDDLPTYPELAMEA